MKEFHLISRKGFTKDLINRYSILNGAKYFAEDGSQNYLVFQSIPGYVQTFTETNKIFSWRYKGLSKESIKTPSDNSFTPKLTFIYGEIRIKFKGKCLIQDSITFIHIHVVNFYIIYELGT